MRVLLIAEQANPEWVSVPLIGWSLCHAISQVAAAHIVTHVRNRDAFLRFGMREGIDFTALDTEAVARPLYLLSKFLRGGDGKGWTTVTALQSLAYYAFEGAVWRTFGKRIQAREFDVVHRVTPLSPTSPSTLTKKCSRAGIPFLMGPLNGGLPWPAGFGQRRRAEREWLSYVRNLYKLMPGYSSSRKYASAIIVGSQATKQQLPKRYQDKTVYMPENGIDLSRFNKHRSKRATLPLIGVFVGRLVPYKCPDTLIKASTSLIRTGKIRLKIVGDGPMRQQLIELARAQGVEHGVEFLGWLSHSDVQSVLVESDFLALPSIREFGGGVVLEAMTCGVTPIVADYGGPAELISADTGFRVPFSDEASLQQNLNVVLSQLVENPALLDERGSIAMSYVRQHFSWQSKAQQLVNIYGQVLETTRAKP